MVCLRAGDSSARPGKLTERLGSAGTARGTAAHCIGNDVPSIQVAASCPGATRSELLPEGSYSGWEAQSILHPRSCTLASTRAATLHKRTPLDRSRYSAGTRQPEAVSGRHGCGRIGRGQPPDPKRADTVRACAPEEP